MDIGWPSPSGWRMLAWVGPLRASILSRSAAAENRRRRIAQGLFIRAFLPRGRGWRRRAGGRGAGARPAHDRRLARPLLPKPPGGAGVRAHRGLPLGSGHLMGQVLSEGNASHGSGHGRLGSALPAGRPAAEPDRVGASDPGRGAGLGAQSAAAPAPLLARPRAAPRPPDAAPGPRGAGVAAGRRVDPGGVGYHPGRWLGDLAGGGGLCRPHAAGRLGGAALPLAEGTLPADAPGAGGAARRRLPRRRALGPAGGPRLSQRPALCPPAGAAGEVDGAAAAERLG